MMFNSYGVWIAVCFASTTSIFTKNFAENNQSALSTQTFHHISQGINKMPLKDSEERHRNYPLIQNKQNVFQRTSYERNVFPLISSRYRRNIVNEKNMDKSTEVYQYSHPIHALSVYQVDGENDDIVGETEGNRTLRDKKSKGGTPSWTAYYRDKENQTNPNEMKQKSYQRMYGGSFQRQSEKDTQETSEVAKTREINEDIRFPTSWDYKHAFHPEENNLVVESGNLIIRPLFRCDYIDFKTHTCWFQREVGDSITLAINITGFKTSESFSVHWIRVFGVRGYKTKPTIDLRAEKTPWNIVIGSGGVELRINPITHTDMDRNGFLAKVYSSGNHFRVNKRRLFKEFHFKISNIPIDMGSVYSGEEIGINVENYISLPQEGITIDWGLEDGFGHTIPLPSNMKVSRSGRSMIIKELKRDQGGIISCIVYSSTFIAVAKRSFRIRTPVEPMGKRSVENSNSLDSDHSLSRDFIPLPISTNEKLFTHRRSKRVKRLGIFQASRNYRSAPQITKGLDALLRNQHAGRSKHEQSVNLIASKHSLSSKNRVKAFLRPSTKRHQTLKREEYDSTITKNVKREAEGGNWTMDDMIPKEVHYVTVKSVLVIHEPLEHFVGSKGMDPHLSATCDSDIECNSHAFCVVSQSGGHAYCICHAGYKGNGVVCYEDSVTPPSYSFRQKRIRPKFGDSRDLGENANEEDRRFNLRAVTSIARNRISFKKSDMETQTTDLSDEDKDTEFSNGLDEVEASLLSSCESDKECSYHAECVQPIKGHGYCKCHTGLRGNGIFCWEDINYVPPRQMAQESEAEVLEDEERKITEASNKKN